jgi:antitoxin (DNA-binding transcriptional repressor) of toxin-antitoxin stability system
MARLRLDPTQALPQDKPSSSPEISGRDQELSQDAAARRAARAELMGSSPEGRMSMSLIDERKGSKAMSHVTLEEAQARLPELLGQLRPGEEMTITDRGQPLAHLKKAERTSWPCKAGSYRKTEFWMAPDFDAPLDDFREYME